MWPFPPPLGSSIPGVCEPESLLPFMNPEAVVQKQLDAYNARDIEAFMEVWAEDAQYYAHPSTILANGAEAIRERHVLRFQEPNLHGLLVKRVVLGSTVVDYETVTRTFPEGPGILHVVAIYEVTGDRISKAWFLIGPKILDSGDS